MTNNVSTSSENWRPPVSFEERLRGALIPPRLYYSLRARREFSRGEAELRILPFLIDPARTAVDAGANKGVYTYWLERLSAHVHAYEPNPKMFDVLKSGVGAKATVHHAALSDQAGSFALRIPKTARGTFSNQGGSLNHDKVGDSFGEVIVETHRLDNQGIKNVGFLKIDVEGHEMAVLDGALQTIARDRPTLLIEMEQQHTKRPIEIDLKRVTDLGYRMLFLRRGVLTDGAQFDPVLHHTNAPSPQDYVFNFIFLPAETPVEKVGV
jgi:FkbM family methyltransferase